MSAVREATDRDPSYGEVMRRFQTLELGLWSLLTRKIKPGATINQAMEMVANWGSTTFGQLMGGMKNQPHWPEELAWKLLEAVKAQPPCPPFAARVLHDCSLPGEPGGCFVTAGRTVRLAGGVGRRTRLPPGSAFPTSAPLR
jgi:hypothetical protein